MKKKEAAGTTSSSPGLSFIIHHSSLIIAFVLGALTVAGYAPLYLFLLPVFTLAGLFYLWTDARTPLAAATTGIAFGLGLFLCGVSWIYVSLHDFGAMPAPVAAAATLLFCGFLALFPAAVGYLCARTALTPGVRWGLLAPALWTLLEWTRGWIFTGFPWLGIGYSQVPASPLAGYAPVFGIQGVTLATAATAGMLVCGWLAVEKGQETRDRERGTSSPARAAKAFIHHPSSIILVVVWLAGFGLKQVAWTQPVGEPLEVSLVQGNVAQDMKWREDRVKSTLDTYLTLIRNTASPLVILPETALPLFLENVPREYLDALAAHMRARGGDVLVGVPERLRDGTYYNSLVSYGTAPTQAYRKSHLVPFGEFIPLRPVLGWIVAALAIPLQDFARGAENQRPLAVAGQRVAVDICYEDAFGEEIIRQLPEATLLVNVSNVAWFGRSLAPQQHLQISQARALETGRYLLRATNTGVTAVIAPNGEVAAAAPEFTMVSITHPVLGYGGATPYVRWGNYAALALCVVLIAAAALTGRRSDRSAA